MNFCVQVFVWIYIFMSLEYITQSRIAAWISKCTFTFRGNRQTVFHGDYAIVRILKSGNLVQEGHMLKYKLI